MIYLTIIILSLLLMIYVRKNYVLFKKINQYEDVICEQGMRNHEYINQLMIVSGYLECKNYKKVKEYLNTVIDDHRSISSCEERELNKIPDSGIKKMIYYKLSKMNDNSIKSYIYVSDNFISKLEKMNIYSYKEITKVLGVLIDNAIDYSILSEKGEIELNLKTVDNKLIIIVSNKISDKINIKKMNKKGYTTKGFGHGFGLQIIQAIIKRNKNMELKSEINNDNFIQTFIVNI